MNHSLTTIICRIPDDRVSTARRLIEDLGNPASPEVQAAFEAVGSESNGALGIHFSSLTVFPATGGGGHLVFEFSGDGPQEALIGALAAKLGPFVAPAFALAADRGQASLDRYWTSHLVTVGTGYFSNPGVLFAGTPGLSVARIRMERRLRDQLRTLVESDPTSYDSALGKVDAVRAQLKGDPDFQWALQPEDAAVLESERPLIEAVRKIAPALALMYLWPLAIPPVVSMVLALLIDPSRAGFMRALAAGLLTALATLGITIALLILAYSTFRRHEAHELPDDRAPEPAVVARIMARENHAAQNHLAGISLMKPGLLRQLTLRFAFAAIGQTATYWFRPGWLGTLGTIHFARWVMVPGTGDLVFLSNYGGSWESYLEDFITKAHVGLTAVWSNTVGFPRTENLVQLGASDGDRFKRWARRQQVPTGCWYTAYPDLTTTAIRTNAAIRQGLGTILTEEEATRWLAMFGSSPRPASALQQNEIQSIAFGGLGFLRYSRCLGFHLNDDRARTREWLRMVQEQVAFGDGRKHVERAVIVALGIGALEKLGLPQESLDTFPPAFVDGMSSPLRQRILGDLDTNASTHWEWGGPRRSVDGLLLLYASSPEEMTALREDMERCCARQGHDLVVEIPFETLPDKQKATAEELRIAKLEPFGFADGISQPVIRGTYKALRGADPIHIVEAGEFILGYPDNRGNLPAGPTLAAIHDPANLLPIAATPQFGFARPVVNDARDLGRNGTFLAVRQLEQDYDAFWRYCTEAADEIKTRFPQWIDVTAEFVGAKLVGRWPDGSSLVRFPYRPGSEEAGDEHPMVRTGAGMDASSAYSQAAPLPPPAVAATQLQHPRTALLHRDAPVKVLKTEAPVRQVAISPDNDFLFGAEDPQAVRCPFGAHIRRANPRESFDPGSQEQLSITNRHRILRVGRRYVPQPDRHPGLFFMCLNADLERQFEFIQQTWLQAPSFHGLMHERDPLLGAREHEGAAGATQSYTIPTREAPVLLRGMPDFIRTLGGGYFFIPGRAFLDYLTRV